MSVFGMSDSDVSKLFLEYITPGLNVEIKRFSKLYDRFKTDSESIVGSRAVFKCLTNAVPGRPSSSSTLPTPLQGTYSEFYLYLKRGYYDTMQYDGLSMASAKGKGAVISIIEAETKGKAIAAANKLNKQFWGDGSGRLAQVVGAVSNSTSVIVDGPLFGQDANFRTNPANFLFKGQYVDIYTTAGVLQAEDAKISAIVDNGDGTATLTMSAALSCSDNAYIFDADTYCTADGAGNGAPMGLYGILGTGNVYKGITAAYFQGVDRTAAANAWARTQSLSNSSLPWSDVNMLRLIMACEDYGKIQVAITNEPIWRAIFQIMKEDNTLTNEKALWGGTKGLSFLGGRDGAIPIIHDKDCPDNTMVLLDDSDLNVFSPHTNGVKWMPGKDGGILTQVQGKDEYGAQMMWYYEFGSKNPQALGLFSAIKHAAV